MCDFLAKGLPRSKTLIVCSEPASSMLNGHLFWSQETDNRKSFYSVHRVVLVPFSEKNTPLAFPNNLPPLPHSHTKNGSAKQQSCLGGGGRAASIAMSRRQRRHIHGHRRRRRRRGRRRQGGGQWRLLCSARVGVGPLMRWLMLRARGPGWHGGGSGARFAWLVSGSGH